MGGRNKTPSKRLKLLSKGEVDSLFAGVAIRKTESTPKLAKTIKNLASVISDSQIENKTRWLPESVREVARGLTSAYTDEALVQMAHDLSSIVKDKSKS